MDPEVLLAQFNRLLTELLRGNMNRNTFQPWEIEILLDIESCELREANKREILRRYQKAVHREMEKGLPTPFRLSQYLEGLKARKAVQSEKREARERNDSVLGTGTLN
jgi:hypothetical protein